jgi:hypothetical protein
MCPNFKWFFDSLVTYLLPFAELMAGRFSSNQETRLLHNASCIIFRIPFHSITEAEMEGKRSISFAGAWLPGFELLRTTSPVFGCHLTSWNDRVPEEFLEFSWNSGLAFAAVYLVFSWTSVIS